MLRFLMLGMFLLPATPAHHSFSDQPKPPSLVHNVPREGDFVRMQLNKQGNSEARPHEEKEQRDDRIIKKRHSVALLLLLLLCGGSFGYTWHNHTLASLYNAHIHEKIDHSFEKLQTSCQNLEKDLLLNKQMQSTTAHAVEKLHEAHRIKDEEVTQKLTLLTTQLDHTTKSCALVQDKVADLGGFSQKLERDLRLVDNALQVTTHTLDDQQKELDSFRADGAAHDARYKADLEKLRAERSSEMALLEQRINGSLKQHQETTKTHLKKQLDKVAQRLTDDVRRQNGRYEELEHRFNGVRQDRDTQESLVAKLRAQRDNSRLQMASSALKIVGAAADWYVDRNKRKKEEQDNLWEEGMRKRLNALHEPGWPDVPTHEPGSKRSSLYRSSR